MASDRMMQAIGALERAISRLERTMATAQEAAATLPPSSMDENGARAALRSLDDLIAELKGMTGEDKAVG